MNEDKSSIEILREYARRTNRKVEYSEKSYPDVHPITFHRRTLYIPNNEFESSYFVCFHDSKAMGEYKLYSGAFITIDVPVTLTARIRRKDWIDKMNPKIKRQTLSIDNTFDTKLLLTGNDQSRIKKIFSNNTVRGIILKAFELEEVLYMGINTCEIDFVPGLKGKSNFGIYTTQKWILERDMIERLFFTVEALRRCFRSD